MEEVLEVTEGPPKAFLEPILLTPPVEDILIDDTRVPIEDTPTVWPEFLESLVPVIGLPTAGLVRLAHVPLLLCRLFLEPELPKEGNGDLDREDEVVFFPIVLPLGTPSLYSSSTFASSLLLALRTKGILLPLATAVVGRTDAMDDLFVGPKGGPILAFEARAGTGLVEVFVFTSVGLGILLVTTGAEAFPRFHTL